MDDVDRANDLAQAALDRAIDAARGVLVIERESASDCIECGEQIPSARQIAVPGCQLCTDCAAIAEQRQMLGVR